MFSGNDTAVGIAAVTLIQTVTASIQYLNVVYTVYATAVSRSNEKRIRSGHKARQVSRNGAPLTIWCEELRTDGYSIEA